MTKTVSNVMLDNTIDCTLSKLIVAVQLCKVALAINFTFIPQFMNFTLWIITVIEFLIKYYNNILRLFQIFQ